MEALCSLYLWHLAWLGQEGEAPQSLPSCPMSPHREQDTCATHARAPEAEPGHGPGQAGILPVLTPCSGGEQCCCCTPKSGFQWLQGWDVSGATQGTCVCLSGAGQGPPGTVGEQKPGDLMGSVDIKTHPLLANEPMAIKPIPEPQQGLSQWPGFVHALADNEDIHDTILARKPYSELVAAGTPCAEHGLRGWGQPPWASGHQRAAGPRCPWQLSAAWLSPPRGSRELRGAQPGARCRRQDRAGTQVVGASAARTCHHLGGASPGPAAGFLPAQ